jgi:hypothetical protein
MTRAQAAGLADTKLRERDAYLSTALAEGNLGVRINPVAVQVLHDVGVEYILDKAGRLLYRDRFIVENLPKSLRTPSELLAWARPKGTVEDNAARVDYIANWFARWLALCLPREDELQNEVLRGISIWARSPPYRFVY